MYFEMPWFLYLLLYVFCFFAWFFLCIKNYKNPIPTVDIIIQLNGDPEKIVLIERKNEPHGWALPGGFVDYGETLEQAAIREAKRCLSCRRCLGCKLCLAVCEPKAIEFGQEEELIELTFDNLVIAPGMERRITPLREELGYGKFPNVVNGVEFEAILRSDGP
ncbi:MAG: NUDIX domain-containing protein, partial [Candidatus Anstonellales archaeon]